MSKYRDNGEPYRPVPVENDGEFADELIEAARKAQEQTMERLRARKLKDDLEI